MSGIGYGNEGILCLIELVTDFYFVKAFIVVRNSNTQRCLVFYGKFDQD